jgi:hypothetical protein
MEATHGTNLNLGLHLSLVSNITYNKGTIVCKVLHWRHIIVLIVLLPNYPIYKKVKHLLIYYG